MKRLFGFKPTVLTLTAIAAIVGLAGAAALATSPFGPTGIISLCFDNSTGAVFTDSACTGNATPFIIQQPYAYYEAKDTEPTGVHSLATGIVEGSEINVLTLDSLPPGIYKIEAKTNLLITNFQTTGTPPNPIETEAYWSQCELVTYTGQLETTWDQTNATTAPRSTTGSGSDPTGDNNAHVAHNLFAVVDLRTAILNSNVSIECQVAALKKLVVNPTTTWNATNSKIAALVLVDARINGN